MSVATTTEELLNLLPPALQADDGAREALIGMLEPVARVNSLLTRKAERLAELLDPARVPDALVVHLAGLVGVGADLPAAASASTADLRKLVAVAVALWKTKGTPASWRSVVAALTGSRTVILDWFYTRTVAGSYGERHTIPAPGTGSALYYANPERVADVWYQDPAGTVDRDLVARFLDVCRAAGERINVYAAYLVEDYSAGLGQWSWDGSGSTDYNAETWELTAIDGATLIPTPTQVAGWTPWVDLHLFNRLAVTGAARVWLRLGTPGTYYEVRIDQDAGTVTLLGSIATVISTLASAAAVIVAGFPYRWSFETWEGYASTTIRVYLEGVLLIDYVDAAAGRAASGWSTWGSLGAGDRATSSTLIAWPSGITPTRVGPTP